MQKHSRYPLPISPIDPTRHNQHPPRPVNCRAIGASSNVFENDLGSPILAAVPAVAHRSVAMLALQLTAEARDDAIAQLGIFRKLVGNVAKKSVAIGRRDRRVPCQYEAWLSCQYEEPALCKLCNDSHSFASVAVGPCFVTWVRHVVTKCLTTFQR
jgi:hypothetical protein